MMEAGAIYSDCQKYVTVDTSRGGQAGLRPFSETLPAKLLKALEAGVK
jgi:hypothetical protein